MKTKGHFQITPCLQEHHAQYLHAFASIRHAHWSESFIRTVPDPLREAVGLPPGEEGLYMIGTPDMDFENLMLFQPEIVESSYSRFTPGSWCQWRPTVDKCGLEWDGNDASRGNHVEWLRFLREHFLDRWGYRLSGSVWISDVFQEQLIEGNIVAAETITLHILQRYDQPEITKEMKEHYIERVRQHQLKRIEEGNEESL